MVTVGTVDVCGVVVGEYCDGRCGWRLRCGGGGDMVTADTVGICGVVGSTASVNMRVALGLEITPKGGGVGYGEGFMDGGGDGRYLVPLCVCMCVHV